MALFSSAGTLTAATAAATALLTSTSANSSFPPCLETETHAVVFVSVIQVNVRVTEKGLVLTLTDTAKKLNPYFFLFLHSD